MGRRSSALPPKLTGISRPLSALSRALPPTFIGGSENGYTNAPRRLAPPAGSLCHCVRDSFPHGRYLPKMQRNLPLSAFTVSRVCSARVPCLSESLPKSSRKQVFLLTLYHFFINLQEFFRFLRKFQFSTRQENINSPSARCPSAEKPFSDRRQKSVSGVSASTSR